MVLASALLVASVSLSWGTAALAAPLPPIPAVDVCGTIVDRAWVPEEHLEAQPGASGSLGRDRTVPAHLRVILAEVAGLSGDLAGRLSNYAGARAGEVPDGGMLLLLEVGEPDDFARATSLCVAGYTVSGDEGITLTSFTSFTLR